LILVPKFIVNENNFGRFDWGAERGKVFDEINLARASEKQMSVNKLRSIIKRDKYNLAAYIELALMEHDKYNYSNALDYYVKGFAYCEDLIPKDFDGIILSIDESNYLFLFAMAGMAKCQLEMNRTNIARTLLEDLVDYDIADITHYQHYLMKALFMSGDFERVLDLSEKIMEFNETPQILYSRAIANFRLGNYEEYVDELKRAVKLAPEFAIVLNQRIGPNPLDLETFKKISLKLPKEDIDSVMEAYFYMLEMGQFFTDRAIRDYLIELTIKHN